MEKGAAAKYKAFALALLASIVVGGTGARWVGGTGASWEGGTGASWVGARPLMLAQGTGQKMAQKIGPPKEPKTKQNKN